MLPIPTSWNRESNSGIRHTKAAQLPLCYTSEMHYVRPCQPPSHPLRFPLGDLTSL